MHNLSDSELRQLMEEIKNNLPDFPITLKDLRSPKAQFMAGYFRTVLKDSGIDISGVMNQPKCGLEYRDVYANILPFVKLLNTVKAFFPENVGLLQYMSIDTLLDPKPSDIQYIKAMNNYHQFSVRRVLEISENPVIKQQTIEVSDCEEVAVKYDELKNMITQQVEDEHLMESRMSELNDATKKMIEERDNLKSVLENEQEIMNDFKEKELIIIRETEKMEEELPLEEEQYKCLAPQLVHSPDRILLAKEEVHKKVESLRKEMEDLSDQMSMMRKPIKEMKTMEKFLLSISEELEAVQSDKKKVQDNEAAISAHNSEQELKHTKVANKMKKLHMEDKAIEEYKSQVVAPFEEKIKELERKEEETSKSLVDLQSRTLEKDSNEELREQALRTTTQRNEELIDLRNKRQYIEGKCKAFIVETRQHWLAVLGKEREELKILEEYGKKEVERLSTLAED